jgi:hypothetical protein
VSAKTIYITMEGGLILDIFSDEKLNLNVCVLDYDAGDCLGPDDEIAFIPQGENLRPAPAWVTARAVETAPPAIIEAIRAAVAAQRRYSPAELEALWK